MEKEIERIHGCLSSNFKRQTTASMIRATSDWKAEIGRSVRDRDFGAVTKSSAKSWEDQYNCGSSGSVRRRKLIKKCDSVSVLSTRNRFLLNMNVNLMVLAIVGAFKIMLTSP